MHVIDEVIDSRDDIDGNDCIAWKTTMTRTHDTEWSFFKNAKKKTFKKWLFDPLKRLFGVSKVAFYPSQMAFLFFQIIAPKSPKTRVFARKV